MDRRKFLQIAGTSTAALTFSITGCQKTKKKNPNIVFILADDLGYGDIGCYGQRRIRTPNIDQLASDGIKFTNHYAGSTVCAPSRCCLMTGYHTGHAYVRGNANKGAGLAIRPEDVTVAELLKEVGYITGCFGKWGLGVHQTTGHPNKKGFDRFFGYLNQVHAHNYYPEFLWDNDQKYNLNNKVRYMQKGYAAGVGGMAIEKNSYSPDVIMEKALQFIDKNKNNPFFLYLPLTLPHANNEWRPFADHGMEVPTYGEYTKKDWPEAQKGLAAMITRLDYYVGRVLERLRRYHIEENTLVFFSSDNGPHKEGGNNPHFFDSNGPLKGIKRDLYEGGIRIPLIIRWPGNIEPHQETDHISAFWDFLPTVCEVANCRQPKNIDGISFLPTLLGKKQKAHKYLYWELAAPGGGKQALRMGKWKGIRHNLKMNPDSPVQLYNLEKDIGEQVNIAEEHPDITKTMNKMMRQVRTKSKMFPLL